MMMMMMMTMILMIQSKLNREKYEITIIPSTATTKTHGGDNKDEENKASRHQQPNEPSHFSPNRDNEDRVDVKLQGLLQQLYHHHHYYHRPMAAALWEGAPSHSKQPTSDVQPNEDGVPRHVNSAFDGSSLSHVMLPNISYEIATLETEVTSLQTVYNLVGMLLQRKTADLSQVSPYVYTQPLVRCSLITTTIESVPFRAAACHAIQQDTSKFRAHQGWRAQTRSSKGQP